jgi:hypothetical protein
LHTVEIIDWYTGGPKPPVLRNLWRKYWLPGDLCNQLKNMLQRFLMWN